MEFKDALKNQHHAALAMMRQAIERPSEAVWLSGAHPRNYWRIAYHALAYAHLYLFPSLAEWAKWEHHRQDCTYLDGDDVPVAEAYSQAQMLEFCDLTTNLIDSKIDAMDLTEATCGYAWYPTVGRAELLILSLRHLHGHLGQLSEILIAEGGDIDWLGANPN